MDAENAKKSSLPGCSSVSTSDSPAWSARSLSSDLSLLLQSLERQSAVMERLANLLPQLVAVNQALLEALADREEQDEPIRYLDGTPAHADRAAGP